MDYKDYTFNKYLSTLQELKLDLYPDEILKDFIDYLNNVPYLLNLTSVNRPYAKDCPRDKEGKIIVDLTNPPIIEDTDYFRPVAKYYQEHKVITNLRPNPNPNSAYGKWVREEVRRCFEGYVRPSDGAWVTGDMYFFLNYCPIMKVKRMRGKKGVRVPDFPDFLEGLWIKFMYIQQARDNAKHGFELAARGKGKAHPYSEKVFTPNGIKLWGSLLVGDYIFGDDGIPTKIISIPYDDRTDIYEVTLDDYRTVRCTSGHLFKVFDYTLGKQVVLPLYLLKLCTDEESLKPRYGIILCKPVQYQYLSIPMLPSKFVSQILFNRSFSREEKRSLLDLYLYNTVDIRKSLLVSILKIKNANLGKKLLVRNYNETYISNAVIFLARSLGLKVKKDKNIIIYPYTKKYSTIISIKRIGYGRAKCITVDNKSHCYLIDDFVVTHNSYAMAAIAAKRFIFGEYDEIKKEILNKTETFIAAFTKDYLSDDGILNKFESYIDFCAENTLFPRKRLTSSLSNMKWTMGYKENNSEAKKGSLNEVIGISVKDNPGKLRGKRGAFIGLEEAGSFPNLMLLYGTLRPSMEDGDIVFGMIYAQGTAGDKESDFSAALQMMYSPRAFNMQAIKNVYDKVGLGGKEFTLFYPAYLNRNGCYNKDGISDNTKALLQILVNRYNVKYNSSDSTLITRTIAEHPIVPQEAILKTKGSMFPVTLLSLRLNELDANPNIYDDVYVGTLVLKKSGDVVFLPTNDEPIRKWPTDDNKEHGALEIYAMPLEDTNGKIYSDRYIIGLDPIDDDTSETMSLYSMFVLDLFTDKIAAEYTGRLDYADDNYELTRKLCLFYNASVLYESNKKGIYAYFKERNALNLLALTPEYLKDLLIIKDIGYGNKAYGVNAVAAVNAYADRLTREWLIKPVVTTDAEGNEIKLPNLMFLKNRAFIQELIAYNPKANFDRIRAFGMLMLYRLSKVIYYEGDLSKSISEPEDKDYAGNDEFFTENYDDNPRVNY